MGNSESYADERSASCTELKQKVDYLKLESAIYETILKYYNQEGRMKESSDYQSSFNDYLKKEEFQFTKLRNDLAVVTVLYLYNDKCNGDMDSLKKQFKLIMLFCESHGYMKQKIQEICNEIEKGFLEQI